MFDIVAASAAAASACKSLIELIGAAKDAKAKEATAKATDAASQLYEQLGQIRIEATNLKVENNDLKNEVLRLKDELERAKATPPAKLERRGEMFYKPNDDQPCCPTCYQRDGKEIYATQVTGRQTSPFGKWHCQICNGYFEAQQAKPFIVRSVVRP